MPRQQNEQAEKLCVLNFLQWYHGKFNIPYKCHGHSIEIYASELHGKNWDWVCRDANGKKPEMAVEILSVVFEDPSIRRGAAYNVLNNTKVLLECHLPGDFFLWIPDELTARQLTNQEQQRITEQLVCAIKDKFDELSILPDGHYFRIEVGKYAFKLQKWAPKGTVGGCRLLDTHMGTPFNADNDEIKSSLTKKIPDKNKQLKIPHEWGFLTILLIQSSGVPHHTAIKDIVNSIDMEQKTNIDKIFIVQTPRFEVFGVN